MLPESAIREFMALYKKYFGKAISYEEAQILANDLINFLWVLLPSNKDEYEKTKNKTI